jgi:hypothetical protein
VRRIPAPLAVILVLAALQSAAWAVLLPPLQGQDEPAHVAYAQRIAEQRAISWSALETIEDDQQQYSTELERAEAYSGAGLLSLNVFGRPYRTEVDEERWRRAREELSDAERADGGFTNAMRNPPLYYLYEAAVYAPLGGTDFFTRLYSMRLATVPFILIAVVFAWLLAGEVFGRRRWLQAVTALTVALQPMLAQLAGIVNPDAAIAAWYAVALWLAALIVRRGATRPRLVGAAALILSSVVLHPRSMPLAVPLVVALLFRLWPHVRARGRPVRFAGVGVLVLGFSAFVGASLVYATRGELTFQGVRRFASYVWQFYLPRPGWMDMTVGPDWGVRDVFVDRLWSGFVLLEVNLAPWVLDLISAATLVGIVMLVVTLVLRRDSLRRRRPLFAVFAAALLGLMWFLHVAAWRDLQLYGDPIITGRYLTPLLPVLGIAIAAVAGSLPKRLGPGLVTVLLGIEALLALSALGTALVRFYA